MRASRVIPPESQEHFWTVLRCCVREFHPDVVATVLPQVEELRARVEGLPDGAMKLFYHSEPFDVACRLAGRPLDVRDHLARYLKIRDGEANGGDDVLSQIGDSG